MKTARDRALPLAPEYAATIHAVAANASDALLATMLAEAAAIAARDPGHIANTARLQILESEACRRAPATVYVAR